MAFLQEFKALELNQMDSWKQANCFFLENIKERMIDQIMLMKVLDNFDILVENQKSDVFWAARGKKEDCKFRATEDEIGTDEKEKRAAIKTNEDFRAIRGKRAGEVVDFTDQVLEYLKLCLKYSLILVPAADKTHLTNYIDMKKQNPVRQTLHNQFTISIL